MYAGLMKEVFEGRCQCGGVAYRVTGQALTLFACHCSECQKQSSSAFGMALWVKHSSIEIVSGHLASWLRQLPSGRQMVCRFCPTCGSRVFHQMADQSELISIKPGTLNDTRWLRPAGHIWSQSAQPWVDLGDSCLVYSGNPPSFEPMLESWANARRASRSQ